MAPKKPLPCIDTAFFIDKLLNCPTIDETTYLNVGSSHSVHIKGNKPLYKKLIIFSEVDNCVTFMHGTGLAAVHGFMGDLLKWFETNRNWKDGGYFKP